MTNYTEPEQLIVRLASLGAVWQQGVIPQEQTTRWTGGYDSLGDSNAKVHFIIAEMGYLRVPDVKLQAIIAILN